MRVAIDVLWQQAYVAHHLDDLRLSLLLVHPREIGAQRFGNDLAYIHARIERRQGVLKDDLKMLALFAQLFRAELC